MYVSIVQRLVLLLPAADRCPSFSPRMTPDGGRRGESPSPAGITALLALFPGSAGTGLFPDLWTVWPAAERTGQIGPIRCQSR